MTLADLKEIVSWNGSIYFYHSLFFSPLKLHMEKKSEPGENNKVQNLTLVKEMREKKHTRSAAPHLCIVEQRMDDEWRTDSVRVNCLHMCACASVQVCVRRDVRVCVCVLGNACAGASMCVRRTGSCAGGRLFLHIVQTLIDNKWVRASRGPEKRRKKRTNSKEDISLCPCFTVTQSDGNQAWWIVNVVKSRNQILFKSAERTSWRKG